MPRQAYRCEDKLMCKHISPGTTTLCSTQRVLQGRVVYPSALSIFQRAVCLSGAALACPWARECWWAAFTAAGQGTLMPTLYDCEYILETF